MNTLNNFSLELVASEFRVDSRLLAPELDHRHRNIYANIVKHQDRFEKLGIVHFEKARVEICGIMAKPKQLQITWVSITCNNGVVTND